MTKPAQARPITQRRTASLVASGLVAALLATLGLFLRQREGLLYGYQELRFGPIEAQLSTWQEQDVERLVKLGPGDFHKIRISESSSKGNGTIELGGVEVHIYDAHDDGVFYPDSFLRLTRRDLDGDGRLELIFSGELMVDASEFEEFSYQAPCFWDSIELILRVNSSGQASWELGCENEELRRFLIETRRVVRD